MHRIRIFEETLADLVEGGEIKTPCHLYIGQEAIAAGVCSALEPSDTIWGGHRSHGHYLAKGGDMDALMAEIFGKPTGCSGGRGGSMHLYDESVGVLGTVPLVAATIPLAVGAALAYKLRKDRQIAVAFFGDGATEEGSFHESLNMAALYSLPVVFVCENNLYASHLHITERRAKDNIADAGVAHGVPSFVVDGNDSEAVFAVAEAAVQRARSGKGPSMIEARTFRWRGHVGPSWDMDVGVLRKDTLKEWIPKDPIARAFQRLSSDGFSAAELKEAESRVREEVRIAVDHARSAPWPDTATLHEHVFALR
jgi:acetoin:2,6-dichlorophenolindophenol oxidoreductase subunit alpha